MGSLQKPFAKGVGLSELTPREIVLEGEPVWKITLTGTPFHGRKEANLHILKVLTEWVERFPCLCFAQIVESSGVGGYLKDEESEEVLKRLIRP